MRWKPGKGVILVTPTYAWQIPHIVRDWLLTTELKINFRMQSRRILVTLVMI